MAYQTVCVERRNASRVTVTGTEIDIIVARAAFLAVSHLPPVAGLRRFQIAFLMTSRAVTDVLRELQRGVVVPDIVEAIDFVSTARLDTRQMTAEVNLVCHHRHIQ